MITTSCFQWFKDTNLKANHNQGLDLHIKRLVVSNGSKILKLAHIRMDFRGIMQSAWTRKG